MQAGVEGQRALAGVESDKRAGIQIDHGYHRGSRSSRTVSSAERPPAGIAVAR